MASRLREAYHLAWADGNNPEDLRSALSGITENDILSESDSTKYFFYYISAGILDYEEREVELRDRYIDIAIALREKSVGILSSEYLELLWTKSYNLAENGREDEAMRLCQKGLVMGHEIIEANYPAARYWYGRLIELLGGLYIGKDWHNQAVSLYNESFEILKEQYDEDDPTSWLPLLRLYMYYSDKEMYEEAYQTNERIGEHIKANGGEHSRHYAGAYKYQRGNMLRRLGRIQEAVESYAEGVNLLNELGLTSDESLGSLYSNWFFILLDNGMFAEADAVEEPIIRYYTANENLEGLSELYWAAAIYFFKLSSDERILGYLNKYKRAVSYAMSMYEEKHDYESGRDFIAGQISRVSETLGEKNFLYADLLNTMAVSFLLQGEGESPIPLLEKAREVYIGIRMQQTMVMALVEHNLGRAYMLCGKYQEAYEYLSKSAELQQTIGDTVMDKTLRYLKEVEEMK